MNETLIGRRVKPFAARGVVVGLMGVAALGFGAGLAHADDVTPPPLNPGLTPAQTQQICAPVCLDPPRGASFPVRYPGATK